MTQSHVRRKKGKEETPEHNIISKPILSSFISNSLYEKGKTPVTRTLKSNLTTPPPVQASVKPPYTFPGFTKSMEHSLHRQFNSGKYCAIFNGSPYAVLAGDSTSLSIACSRCSSSFVGARFFFVLPNSCGFPLLSISLSLGRCCGIELKLRISGAKLPFMPLADGDFARDGIEETWLLAIL